MGRIIPSAKQVLTVLSLGACLFFGVLKSGEIVDAIEHSGRIGAGHSHSAISLASMDIDHDIHESHAQNPSDDGIPHNDDDPSGPDLAHHHHHHDVGSDAVVLNGMAAEAPLPYAVVARPAERLFHAFGPSDGLKRPPRTISQHV